MTFREVALFFWYTIMLVMVLRVFLRENRSPASRIAWMFVIITVPYLGVLAYLLLGEVNIGRSYNIRLAENIRKLYRQFGGRETGNWEVSKEHLKNDNYRNIFSYSTSITPLEPTFGNKAELIPDEDRLERLIADIDAAKESVHGIYYIWLEDDSGTAFAEALIRAAKRGVKCRVMADAMGSRKIIKADIWQRMIDEGVDLRVALPMRGLMHAVLSARFDLRNHRKITVIDNKITYIGSKNLADPEFRTKAKYAPWVDISLRMQGPVVQQNNLLFMSDWMMVSDEKIEDIFKTDPKKTETKSGFLAVVVPDGPDLRVDAIPQLYELMFAAAREEINITTPYFVPNEGLVDAMCSISYAGVKVTLNLPKKNDSMVVGATSKSYYKELLSAGVEIYEYQKGILHSKIAIVDSNIVMIGSSNLDRRSFDLNYENNVLLEDTKLAKEIRERQLEYIAKSEPVKIEDVNAWPYWKRAWNNMMAMLSPIL